MFVINYCKQLVDLLAQDTSTHLRGIEQLIQMVDLEIKSGNGSTDEDLL